MLKQIPTGKIKSYIGEKFSYLTVLYRTENIGKKVAWACQCDCGNIIAVRGDHLISGAIKSCGCYQKKFRKQNLIGKRFNRLVVLEEDVRKTELYRQGTYWKCQCDCGNIVSVRGNLLNNNNTQSCGCLQRDIVSKNNFKSILGQRFGLLTVIEEKIPGYNASIRKCQCDCGNVILVNKHSLCNGSTQSCGCLTISHGELKIATILAENHILFDRQKTFDTCKFPKTNAKARFDFYIPHLNLLIEFDGKQHFKSNSFFSDSLQDIIERDQFKNDWCKKNRFLLKRIPYFKENQITIDYLLDLKEDVL